MAVSRLLTIYDLELEMRWEGVAEDGSEVKGTLRIPEVSHEAIDGLSDYVVRIFPFSSQSPADQAPSSTSTSTPHRPPVNTS